MPTSQIQQELEAFTAWNEVDRLTLSGSGEPSLALNLGEILEIARDVSRKPTAVLTNGSLLHDPVVQSELAIADHVAVKLDAISADQFRCINRPIDDIYLSNQWSGLQQFRQQYGGKLAIQTMMLAVWSDQVQADYIVLVSELSPDEIQLNTPTRPKPLTHQLAARGNHLFTSSYPVRLLKPVTIETLRAFADRIQAVTGIPVRYPHLLR